MQNNVRYPLGIQTFEKLIDEERFYVDKTEYVYRMTHSESSYIFLSRPRRFGKSLLTSTLKSYFEGRKDLFKGLAIEKLEKEWDTYPVLHFDLSTAKHSTKEELESELNIILSQHEAVYGKGEKEEYPNQRLRGLIERAYKQTGKKVVVLIDEYDAPLLDVGHEEEHLPILRQVMRNFYSPLKYSDPYLRFVFLTGITKFSQLSIFSELNNIRNISMEPEYAGICGITESEMLANMTVGIDNMAQALGLNTDETVAALKRNYDGYHFTYPSEDIYNPYSLLNAMASKALKAYWFGSGTPTYLIEMLRKFGVNPSKLGSPMYTNESYFDAPTETMTSIIPLLYQSGYITIKDYDDLSELYTLGIPNREIRIGLLRSLLPNYLGQLSVDGNTTASRMQVALLQDDIERMLCLLQEFLGTIPYANDVNSAENYEGHWQQLLYTIFSLLGAKGDIEVHTPKGRVDFVAQTAKHLYLFELKLNRDASVAMAQTNLNDYASRFALCGLPTVKIGVNFDATERNITDWKIEAT